MGIDYVVMALADCLSKICRLLGYTRSHTFSLYEIIFWRAHANSMMLPKMRMIP